MKNYIKYNIQNVRGARRAVSLIEKQPKKQSPLKPKPKHNISGTRPSQKLDDKLKRLENELSVLKNQSHIVEDLNQIKNDLRMIKSYLFGASSNSKLRKTSQQKYDDMDQQETIYTIGRQVRIKSNSSEVDEHAHNTAQNQYQMQYNLSNNSGGNLKNSRTSNSPQRRVYRIEDIIEQKTKKNAPTYNKTGIPLKSLQSLIKDYKLQGPEFGTIFYGFAKRNSQPVAVKYFQEKLDHIIQVYDRLWKNIAKAQWPCINRIFDYRADNMNILVMERNKSNIAGLPYRNILIDLVKIIEFIHDCGYLYRNIQPQHFMLNQEGQLVVIDFKRARRYVDIKGHAIEVCDTIYTGSPFASNNQVRGLPQSRKDDLQSIGYLALLLYQMEIPWGGMGKDQVIKIRTNLTLQQLFKERPQWIEYMAYVMRLPKNERPDYRYLCQVISRQ